MQRIRKTQGSFSTLYVSGDFEIINNAPTLYVFAGSLRIAKITDTPTEYYHKDHLGSTVAMTTESGSIIDTGEYMPYGPDRSSNGLLYKSSYKYTDQEQDDGTGLYNYDARLYDPVLGQFVMADTIVPDPSNPQTLNRHSYCGNNPLVYVDPTGHSFGSFLRSALGNLIGGAIGIMTGNPFLGGMIAGAISSGSIQGAIAGGISGGFFYAAGSGAFGSDKIFAHTIAGGLSGGTNAAINGGNIGIGMLTGGVAGGIGAYGGGFMKGNGMDSFGEQFVGRTMIGGLSGGITSAIAGGSFGDGFNSEAQTAAFGFLFNDCVHEFEEKYFSVLEQRKRADTKYTWWKAHQQGEYHHSHEAPYMNMASPKTMANAANYIVLVAGAFATGWVAPEIYALSVTYVLKNPQGALNFVQNIFPSSGIPTDVPGAIGSLIGEGLNTQKLILSP